MASPRVERWMRRLTAGREWPYAGLVTLLVGGALITAIMLLTRQAFPVPAIGAAYAPLIAMLAYYWGWPLGLAGCALQAIEVYLILLPPGMGVKEPTAESWVDLLVLSAISVYILFLVQLARNRRDAAEREVMRFAALNTVGVALAGELHEDQLLQLIARTACELTGAGFAAFTLRPVDAQGKPIAPAEGSHFHLAAVVGVTPAQEDLFRRVPLGGEGLLAPIFRHGVTVRVDDALAHPGAGHQAASVTPVAATSASVETPPPPARESRRDAARRQALSYARGRIAARDLRAVGAPRGHPIVRSFLGAPLLDREGVVRGGLLLGHAEPERFTKDDETILEALAAQAAVAIENARLYDNARSQAAELNAVFESISDGVMVYGSQGELLHENHAASVIRAELELPTNAEAKRAAMESMTNASGAPAQRSRATLALVSAESKQRDFAVSRSPLQSSAPIGVSQAAGDIPDNSDDRDSGAVLVWRDVTETHALLVERQAHAEAETRLALLQQVIDEQPGGVYLVRGRDARLALANRAAQAVWGAHWDEGQTMEDFLAASGTQILATDGRPLPPDEFATLLILRTGEPIRHYQEVIRQPTGDSLPVLLNAVSLDPRMLPTAPGGGNTTEGEPVALVVLQDMTAIKEAERLKDEFIAIAAHELKTPMAAVKGYADTLTRQAHREGATPLEPWQLEALETIDQATNRLVELTEDLLDVARLQADRLQLHIEPHDLIALARRVIKRFKMTSERHTLALNTTDEYVVAEVDVRRTEQIIGNLLSNAIKYSPDGGPVTVTIERGEDGFAKLCVRDRGIGIPPDQQALLFNRFARADNARERGIAGAGLGLYLCRELAELQGGRLWFESEENHGSVFYLTAPLAVEES